LIKNTWTYRKIISKKYGDLGMFVIPLAWISIFFTIFLTIYFFIKTFFNFQKEIIFLQNSGINLFDLLNLNFYAIEHWLFLLISNRVFLFVMLFLIFCGGYIYYASRKVGKIEGLLINLPLYFFLFSILFGIWWIISIFYAIFAKDIKWR